ncbi:MAG: sugar O-acetyltransferase [Clostridiales bacterium]|jgi:maltose O-acetyltransferase|nr:sugar O-acetyltransferase [Clostridiales bacterium]
MSLPKSKPYIFDEKMYRKFYRAAQLTREYNELKEDDTERKESLLAELLGKKGENVLILSGLHCEFGKNITVGNNVVINYNCFLMDNAEIVIGDNVLIGPNVSIYAVNHALDPAEREQGFCVNSPVHIGNRVWLCGDVKITAGVTIGDDSVIGAGSVVTKDIPSGVIAAGNPCRVIREITKIDKLGCLGKEE